MLLPDMVRRISGLLVALALIVGPGMSSVYAASMAAKMTVAASSDMHSPGKCDDCGSTNASMSVGMCSALYCSGFAAFPFSSHAVFDGMSADTHVPCDGRHIARRVNPPDPYPPRLTILS